MNKRQILLFVCCVASAFQVYSADIKTTPKITDVTVYLQGASVFSSASVRIPEGVSKVILTDLPTFVNQESIQVAGKGDFTIINVLFQQTVERTQIVDSLTKVKQTLTDKQKELSYTKDVYKTQIDVLNANKDIKGTNANLSTIELEKVLKFYQKQLLDFNAQMYEIEKRQEKIEEDLTVVENELATYSDKQNKGEVVVTVSSNKAQTIDLGLSYFFNNAGWTPFYEVRVADVDKDLQVIYKAEVYQTSGYDWNNISVTLSTGNPTLNGTIPTLDKWVLQQKTYNHYGRMKAEDNTEMDLMVFGYAAPVSKSAKVAMATTNEKTTSVEFTINEKFSVKSSQNDAKVTIHDYSMPASYIYRCVPKLDRHAYLLAKVTNFSQYNFLSGNAWLYLDGNYVGTSYLDIAQTTDTLQFSLGQDNGIVVERKLADDFSSKKSISKNYKQAIAWNISAKNNKRSDVTLEIADNIPVAGNSQIEVSDVKNDGAQVDDQNIATWRFSLKPGESKKVTLSYIVTYPKTMDLDLR